MVATARPQAKRSPAAPRLRVVPAAAAPVRTRRAVAVVAMLFGVLLLFGVAASHVVLAQNQSKLDELDRRARDAQATYAKLRYEVAQLESPERIVADAQQRLGMIAPPEVTYVNAPPSPVGATELPAGNGAAGSAASAPTGDWRRVKAELAGR